MFNSLWEYYLIWLFLMANNESEFTEGLDMSVNVWKSKYCFFMTYEACKITFLYSCALGGTIHKVQRMYSYLLNLFTWHFVMLRSQTSVYFIGILCDTHTKEYTTLKWKEREQNCKNTFAKYSKYKLYKSSFCTSWVKEGFIRRWLNCVITFQTHLIATSKKHEYISYLKFLKQRRFRDQIFKYIYPINQIGQIYLYVNVA